MFLSNKYSKWYVALISKRKQTKVEGYGEVHHIIPRCLGGDNSKSNLVKLTPREHFVAHKLLTKMTVGTDRRKMLYALKRTVSSKTHTINSREYERIRREYSTAVSVTLSGRTLTAEHRENISKAFSGKPKSESFKKLTSDRMNDPLRDAERREKIRSSLRGRKISEETRRKIAETRRRKFLEGTLVTRWSAGRPKR
jgi:hypothetical protein